MNTTSTVVMNMKESLKRLEEFVEYAVRGGCMHFCGELDGIDITLFRTKDSVTMRYWGFM